MLKSGRLMAAAASCRPGRR